MVTICIPLLDLPTAMLCLWPDDPGIKKYAIEMEEAVSIWKEPNRVAYREEVYKAFAQIARRASGAFTLPHLEGPQELGEFTSCRAEWVASPYHTSTKILFTYFYLTKTLEIQVDAEFEWEELSLEMTCVKAGVRYRRK